MCVCVPFCSASSSSSAGTTRTGALPVAEVVVPHRVPHVHVAPVHRRDAPEHVVAVGADAVPLRRVDRGARRLHRQRVRQGDLLAVQAHWSASPAARDDGRVGRVPVPGQVPQQATIRALQRRIREAIHRLEPDGAIGQHQRRCRSAIRIGDLVRQRAAPVKAPAAHRRVHLIHESVRARQDPVPVGRRHGRRQQGRQGAFGARDIAPLPAGVQERHPGVAAGADRQAFRLVQAPGPPVQGDEAGGVARVDLDVRPGRRELRQDRRRRRQVAGVGAGPQQGQQRGRVRRQARRLSERRRGRRQQAMVGVGADHGVAGGGGGGVRRPRQRAVGALGQVEVGAARVRADERGHDADVGQHRGRPAEAMQGGNGGQRRAAAERGRQRADHDGVRHQRLVPLGVQGEAVQAPQARVGGDQVGVRARVDLGRRPGVVDDALGAGPVVATSVRGGERVHDAGRGQDARGPLTKAPERGTLPAAPVGAGERADDGPVRQQAVPLAVPMQAVDVVRAVVRGDDVRERGRVRVGTSRLDEGALGRLGSVAQGVGGDDGAGHAPVRQERPGRGDAVQGAHGGQVGAARVGDHQGADDVGVRQEGGARRLLAQPVDVRPARQATVRGDDAGERRRIRVAVRVEDALGATGVATPPVRRHEGAQHARLRQQQVGVASERVQRPDGRQVGAARERGHERVQDEHVRQERLAPGVQVQPAKVGQARQAPVRGDDAGERRRVHVRQRGPAEDALGAVGVAALAVGGDQGAGHARVAHEMRPCRRVPVHLPQRRLVEAAAERGRERADDERVVQQGPVGGVQGVSMQGVERVERRAVGAGGGGGDETGEHARVHPHRPGPHRPDQVQGVSDAPDLGVRADHRVARGRVGSRHPPEQGIGDIGAPAPVVRGQEGIDEVDVVVPDAGVGGRDPAHLVQGADARAVPAGGDERQEHGSVQVDAAGGHGPEHSERPANASGRPLPGQPTDDQRVNVLVGDEPDRVHHRENGGGLDAAPLRNQGLDEVAERLLVAMGRDATAGDQAEEAFGRVGAGRTAGFRTAGGQDGQEHVGELHRLPEGILHEEQGRRRPPVIATQTRQGADDVMGRRAHLAIQRQGVVEQGASPRTSTAPEVGAEGRAVHRDALLDSGADHVGRLARCRSSAELQDAMEEGDAGPQAAIDDVAEDGPTPVGAVLLLEDAHGDMDRRAPEEVDQGGRPVAGPGPRRDPTQTNEAGRPTPSHVGAHRR